MKILLISSSDLDGGANVAAYRLLEAFQQENVDSYMLVRRKRSQNSKVKILSDYTLTQKWGAGYLDTLPRWMLEKDSSLFSIGFSLNSIVNAIEKLKPDLVHLHWPHNGVINFKSLTRINAPIVWTLHDMWAFTGGCHYAKDCQLFEEECSHCPQIRSAFQALDITNRIHLFKQRIFGEISLSFVTPSVWMADMARRSSLLRDFTIDTIPYSIDTNIFTSEQRSKGRDLIGLKNNEKAILFINPTQERKGARFVPSLIELIAKKADEKPLKVVYLGPSPEITFETSLQFVHLGHQRDPLIISQIFAGCDVMVLPSLEDNLPNVVIESLCCGTPVSAFRAGGIPEMIQPDFNGELVDIGELHEMTDSIFRLLNFPVSKRAEISERAKLRYSQKAVTESYITVYRKAIEIYNLRKKRVE